MVFKTNLGDWKGFGVESWTTSNGFDSSSAKKFPLKNPFWFRKEGMFERPAGFALLSVTPFNLTSFIDILHVGSCIAFPFWSNGKNWLEITAEISVLS